ncbi:MAG: protein DA1 [Deltaproteobacteria bacterium]|nr:protein DA1 [Deltaproteobacteria bacterium]
MTQTLFDKYKKTGQRHQIFILYGLPKIEFAGVLAHEFIHVWQNENNFKLSPMHAEGLCNLASYWIYLEDSSDFAQYLNIS